MVESIGRCGRVVSGRGKSTSKLLGRRELFDYFGAEPQPGSLNVILDRPILFRPDRAKVRLEAPKIWAWAARMEGHPCLLQRPRNCPLHVIEVISPYRFQIQKGSPTLVIFDAADTAPINWGRLFVWGCLWYLRRSRVYSDKPRWVIRLTRRLQRWSGEQDLQDLPEPNPGPAAAGTRRG